jgi:glucans biosynthesis protein
MSDNPVNPKPNWRVQLQMAQAAPRCGARARWGRLCRCPAMPNGRCRLHGGASPGAPRGEGHGMWRHGLRSLEVIERRRKVAAETRELRRLMRELAGFS